MKKLIFCLVSILILKYTQSYGVERDITNSGFAFSPTNITINYGDIVSFKFNAPHSVIEVDKATWDANGNSQLLGGFSLPIGGGKLTNIPVGTHYYVCGLHYFMGMKGIITVKNQPKVVLSNGGTVASATLSQKNWNQIGSFSLLANDTTPNLTSVIIRTNGNYPGTEFKAMNLWFGKESLFDANYPSTGNFTTIAEIDNTGSGLGAGTYTFNYFQSALNLPVTKGQRLYFIITADVNSTACYGTFNVAKIDSTDLTFNIQNIKVTGSSAAGGVQTIGHPNTPLTPFTASDTMPTVCEDVIFYYKPLSNQTEWLWDYGDGTTFDNTTPNLNNSGNINRIYSKPGNYQVKMVAFNSCGGKDSITKTIMVMPNQPLAPFKVSDTVPLICDNINGLYYPQANQVKWLWYFGDGTTYDNTNPAWNYNGGINHIFKTPGTFQIKLVAFYSCSNYKDSITKTIMVQPNPPLTPITISDTVPLVCETVNYWYYTQANQVEWLWNYGDGTTFNNTNSTLNYNGGLNHIYSKPGTYIVKMVAFYSCGSKDSITKTIIVRPYPSLEPFTVSDTTPRVCENIKFLKYTSGYEIEWNWDFGDGSSDDITSSYSEGKGIYHIYLSPGSYNVKLAVTLSCGIKDSILETIVVKPRAIITPESTTSFCAGSSVILDANAGTEFTYQWQKDGQDIAGATYSSYTAVETGNYTVDLNVSNSCSSRAEKVNVTVNALPVVSVNDVTVCQGATGITITAITSDNVSFLWSNGSKSDANVVTSAGQYCVTVITGNGCQASTCGNVIIYPLPTAYIIPAYLNISVGNPLYLQLISNDFKQLKYSWFHNGKLIAGTLNSAFTIQSSVMSDAGIYSVTVKDTLTGCTNNSGNTIVTVNRIPIPVISASGRTTFCAGGSVMLSTNYQVIDVTFQWLLNGVNIAGATKSSFYATESGDYFLKVKYAGNYALSAAVKINVIPLPFVLVTPAGPVSFTTGQPLHLTAITAVDIKFQWQKNGSDLADSTNSQFAILNLQTSDSGTYTVTVTNNLTGCTNISKSVIVTVNQHQSLSIIANGPLTFCSGGNVLLTTNNHQPATKYQWLQNGNYIRGATGSSFTANTSGDYNIIVTRSGLVNIAPSVKVKVFSLPIVFISPSRQFNLSPGETFILRAKSPDAISYHWMKNSQTIAGATHSTFTILLSKSTDAGTYTVQLTNRNYCSATSNAVTVTFNGQKEFSTLNSQFSIRNNPNPFHNETKIEYVLPEPGEVTLKVYDMMGREVAKLVNSEQQDEGKYVATFNGEALPQGIYIYRLVLRTKDSEFIKTEKMILNH